eukprot:superscaffoldBa00012259_g25589
MIGNATEDGVTMTCEVQGAFPEPKVEWQDSDRNVLPADEPQVSERGGRFYITLQTTVKQTKTNRFYCVAKQENISHMVDAEITVPAAREPRNQIANGHAVQMLAVPPEDPDAV